MGCGGSIHWPGVRVEMERVGGDRPSYGEFGRDCAGKNLSVPIIWNAADVASYVSTGSLSIGVDFHGIKVHGISLHWLADQVQNRFEVVGLGEQIDEMHLLDAIACG